MKPLHYWVIALAVLTFVAGVLVGGLFSSVFQRESGLDAAYAEYEKRFIENFQPDNEQLSLVRRLFRRHRAEEEKIKNRYVEELEPQLRKLAEKNENDLLIILTPEQRAKYDKLLESNTVALPEPKKGS